MTRWLRRLGLVYLLALAWFVVLGVAAAAANASTATTTPVNFLDHVPVPYLAGILIGAGVIPMLSALATSHPGALTGLWTAGLALLDAVLTAVAHAGNDNWKSVAGAAVSTWLGAAVVHSKIVKRRDGSNQPVGFEGFLHARGVTGQHRVSGQRGAVEPVTLFAVLALVLVLVLLFTGHWLIAIVALAVCVVAAVLIR